MSPRNGPLSAHYQMAYTVYQQKMRRNRCLTFTALFSIYICRPLGWASKRNLFYMPTSARVHRIHNCDSRMLRYMYRMEFDGYTSLGVKGPLATFSCIVSNGCTIRACITTSYSNSFDTICAL